MNASQEQIFYALALSMIEGLGPILSRKLIAHCGSPKAVFEERPQALMKLPGLGTARLKRLGDKSVFDRAERELQLVEKEAWFVHYWTDTSYPRRLRHCDDAPLVLFQRGRADLNPKRALAVVGSRLISEPGQLLTQALVEKLADYQVQVISGLAYGTDGLAHRIALESGSNTVAVVAHGLDRVYPYLHRKLAENILESGGSLLSEFVSGTNPDRENFPKRNRIIAGMSDAVLVVEAARKGGALITANCANDYNREVFAVPGAPGQKGREGCNLLIKSHRAYLLESVRDLQYVLRWEPVSEKESQKTYQNLPTDQQELVDLLGHDRSAKDLDWLCKSLNKPASQIMSTLVILELEGLIRILPGNRYHLLS